LHLPQFEGVFPVWMGCSPGFVPGGEGGFHGREGGEGVLAFLSSGRKARRWSEKGKEQGGGRGDCSKAIQTYSTKVSFQLGGDIFVLRVRR
jgi:hypothetical protein